MRLLLGLLGLLGLAGLLGLTATRAAAEEAQLQGGLASSLRGRVAGKLSSRARADAEQQEQGQAATELAAAAAGAWWNDCTLTLGAECTPGSQDPAKCCKGDGDSLWCGADTPGYPLDPSHAA